MFQESIGMFTGAAIKRLLPSICGRAVTDVQCAATRIALAVTDRKAGRLLVRSSDAQRLIPFQRRPRASSLALISSKITNLQHIIEFAPASFFIGVEWEGSSCKLISCGQFEMGASDRTPTITSTSLALFRNATSLDR